MWHSDLAESGRLPDWLIRGALRLSLGYTARKLDRQPIEERDAERRALLARLRSLPIAIDTADPNAQHYEVPGAFFTTILDPRLKYSCCLWTDGITTLAAAEKAMLALTCQRADLWDGQDVLELGCGWGSLTLWMAEQYPHSNITAMSNSRTQREHIQAQAAARGVQNVTVLTADMVTFGANGSHDGRYDRVVAVEMFEHMKNYERLMARVAGFLRPGGRLFVHILCHRDHAHEFDAVSDDWMARTFFTGGTMPDADLLLHFQRDLVLAEQWLVDGRHYARTLRAWLDRLDAQRPAVEDIMAETYGQDQVHLRVRQWRLFLIACEETFGMRRGREYLCCHYLFNRRDRALDKRPAMA